MRTWTVTTTYQGVTDLQVMQWAWQRQAYRYAIDWFTEDDALEAITVIDDSGHADTLTLTR